MDTYNTVDAWEAFKKIGGKFQFHHMEGILQKKETLYVAKWKNRIRKNSDPSFYDVRELETKDRGPKVQQKWTVVEDIATDWFIKVPRPIDFIDNDLEERMAREIGACELIREHPHPNIATYYGCVNTNGRASALCYKKYQSTVLERFNPRCLNKEQFISSNRECTSLALDGLFEAICHLHNLGIVHNDINPANVMLDDKDSLVLVDFDSCRFLGESLVKTKARRTWGWYDPEVKMALTKNDLDAFAELKTWLHGSVEDLQFK